MPSDASISAASERSPSGPGALAERARRRVRDHTTISRPAAIVPKTITYGIRVEQQPRITMIVAIVAAALAGILTIRYLSGITRAPDTVAVVA